MKKASIQITGIVQGVGFRPFVHRLIKENHLAGWIRNTKAGVEMEAEGNEADLRKLIAGLRNDAPAIAVIEDVQVSWSEDLAGYVDFDIRQSDCDGEKKALISPDVGICKDCLRELYDPSDRRYRYPFINCTNCGPRFTIIKEIPYDRKNTTMAGFTMCERCASEYTDIENRRYHAQPDCCPDCGPAVRLLDRNGKEMPGDPLQAAREALKEGRIVAIKGIGGFHLACRADQEETIRLLRTRKHRDEKPFALMCRDITAAKKLACVGREEERELNSPARPIVLLKKKNKAEHISISENGYIGIMLPYTPLHSLLFGADIDTLVMTSANLSDLPVIYTNEQAMMELQDIADAYLIHDRDIETRCDDSLAWVVDGKPYFVRRSRGYVPYPITLKTENHTQILALGAEQKASFVMTKGSYAFASQHIGDLKNIETFENYEAQIRHFEKMFDIRPERLVCDLHPDYLSTEYAERRSRGEGIPLLHVQHHHAHMAACMADNGLTGDCIGIIWDGTGLGTDGTIWGGEFLSGGYREYCREGTIRRMQLPGGDRAITEIFRVGIALLMDAGVDSGRIFPGDRADRIRTMIEAKLNCPISTGMGRLFDGVSAILGIRKEVSYEGQGAVLLETAAGKSEATYPYVISEGEPMEFDFRPMIRAMVTELEQGRDRSLIAADFMNTLVDMAIQMCRRIREKRNLNSVVLSGGSFQNLYMLYRIKEQLQKAGFRVYTHSRVSTNDEGISLGQAAIAACRSEEQK